MVETTGLVTMGPKDRFSPYSVAVISYNIFTSIMVSDHVCNFEVLLDVRHRSVYLVCAFSRLIVR